MIAINYKMPATDRAYWEQKAYERGQIGKAVEFGSAEAMRVIETDLSFYHLCTPDGYHQLFLDSVEDESKLPLLDRITDMLIKENGEAVYERDFMLYKPPCVVEN